MRHEARADGHAPDEAGDGHPGADRAAPALFIHLGDEVMKVFRV
jgi:hypothetical protein